MNKSSLLVTVLSLVVAASAQASKYIVVFKNQQNFSQAHSQWVLANESMVNRLFAGRKAKLQVQESLEQIQALVIESQDEKLITALIENSGVIVEKEVFMKAPAPVGEFKLTSPWSFDANYAVSADVFKKKNPKKNPKTQPEAAENNDLEASADHTPWGIKSVKAREAWDMSRQGQGARVLVLDSGVDKNHPALKNQIEAMKDFVGDNQMPYDVVDKVGHGTHVAGTIAAEEALDGFVGVAPKAKLLIGRVCNEEGCSSIDIARGINWGIEQKVDVINMSLGSDFPNQATQAAVVKAEKAGVIVVAASGNDGKNTVGYPAAYPTVIAVGATDVNSVKADFSQWGPELDVVAPGVDVFSSVPMGSGCESVAKLTQATTTSEIKSTCFSGSAFIAQGLEKELVFAGLGKPEDFAGHDLTGKFALISRGEILFTEKVQNAIKANAEGVVIFNNTAGLMSGSLTEDGSLLAIPVVMIEQTSGEQLKADLSAGKTATLEVKTAATDFSYYSGTSMASPHTAGVVALIRATKKSLTPAQVRELLKTTATELGPNTANEYGAGLIDAEKAVTKASSL